jgi:hypothetical protein
VIRHAGARARIIRLLRLPGDNTTLDVDLPAAGTRAVHAVRRAHDLVVLPTLPIAFLLSAVFVAKFAMAVDERFAISGKVSETLQEMAHGSFPLPYVIMMSFWARRMVHP